MPAKPQPEAAPRFVFTTAKRRKELIPFELDGEIYHFNPPKDTVAMMPFLDPDMVADDNTVTQAKVDWFIEGLPADEFKRILARIKDDEDGLNMDMILDLIKLLVGQVTGRPTK